jgi:hypothetical protein
MNCSHEICAQVQAPRGVCRFCGCTDIHACLDPVTKHGCHWTDPRKTICSALECRVKYMALQPETLKVFHSHACICRGYKARNQVLCPVCWALLPWEISAQLYEPLSRGLSVYYAEAVAFLSAWRAQ